MTSLQAIIALIAFGFVLIASEVFVPGMILGAIGGLCLTAAVIISFISYGSYVGLLMLLGVGVSCIIGFFIWLFFFPKTYLGRKITNRIALNRNTDQENTALLGKTGVTLTMLRPSGTAQINGGRVDVTAEDRFIESGATIQVIGIEGTRVVVRALEKEEGSGGCGGANK